MLKFRKRAIAMMLAAGLCSLSFTAGSMTASAQEYAQAGQTEDQGEVCLREESLTSGEGSLDAAWDAARGETLKDGDYQYEVLEDNTVEICKYYGKEKNIRIPAKIDGKDVTVLGYGAFSHKDIERVEIPSGVKEISYNAFFGCEYLKEVVIPDSVIVIETGSFQYCTSLESVVIPGSVEAIGKGAFCGCSSLTGITIPASVKSFGYGTFANCSNLAEIKVDSGNEKYASQDGLLYTKDMKRLLQCPGAKKGSIIIPASVELVDTAIYAGEYDAFRGCRSLTEILVDSGNEKYASQDGLLYNKSMSTLERCPEGKTGSVELPQSLDSIGRDGFYECTKVEHVELPEGLQVMGEGAFCGCRSLKGIRIPASVTVINWLAFDFCDSLSGIEVDSGNEKYASQDGVLYKKDMSELLRCPGGKTGTVTVAKTASFEANAFWCCKNLEGIIVDESNENYMSKDGVLYTKDMKSLVVCPGGKTGNMTIPETVRSLGSLAFNGCSKLESITFNKWQYFDSFETDIFGGCKAKWVVPYMSGAESYAISHGIPYQYLPCTEQTHVYKRTLTPATSSKNGRIAQKCQVCGKEKDKTTIYAAKAIKLSKDSFTYNKKQQKPSVTVKDSKGKALKAGKDYTVSYPKNAKNVGSYAVTVTLQGNYTGSVSKSYTIAPKATSIAKVTPKKKGFAVKWKKQADQTTGYEIAYSTDKKFSKKGSRVVPVGKNKTVSKTISKLKAKKKYYVRVRTYKTVKAKGKSIKIYSQWSKVKTVTTKK